MRVAYTGVILLYWKYKMYWRKQPPIEQASIAEIAIFLTQYYMNFWRQQISTQGNIKEIDSTCVYSIHTGSPMTLDDSDEDSTDEESGTVILQKYYRYITPPRQLVGNSAPPALNKYCRIIKDIITQASLDPSSPFYEEYSPPPTPSRPPYAERVMKILQGNSWPTESVSKRPYDQISWSTDLESTPDSESSNKENIPPITKHNACHCSLKQENNAQLPQKESHVIGSTEHADTCTALHRYQRCSGHELLRQKDLGSAEKSWKNKDLLQYKRPEELGQNSTLIPQIDMQPSPGLDQSFFHPHTPIITSRNLQNPVTRSE